ncbi:MAG: hypothetical protein BGO95_05850 [Micrococcales bacterium 73-13]|nr:MAG: hypothetical protein BGO95_05850 [Micrococcales bacterium 73-13]
MPVNPDLQGRVYPPTAPLLVTAARIAEFAAAVGASDPAAPIAPPTFAIVVQQAALDALLADPDAGFEIRDVVHGEQRFALARPIVPGDELTGTMSVTGIRTLGANAMVTAETRIADASGETVATATSMLLVGGGS